MDTLTHAATAARVSEISVNMTSAMMLQKVGEDNGLNRTQRRAKQKRDGTLFQKRALSPSCLISMPVMGVHAID